jgi:hypothetical protein
VVDGQQRLTTLSLVLAAVSQHLDDAEANGARLRAFVLCFGVARGR